MSTSGCALVKRWSRRRAASVAGSDHCRSSMQRRRGVVLLHPSSSTATSSTMRVRASGTVWSGTTRSGRRSTENTFLTSARGRVISASNNGPNGRARSSTLADALSTVIPNLDASDAAASRIVDLPIPGSPVSNTIRPRPRRAPFNASVTSRSSASRPTMVIASSPRRLIV